MQLTLIGVGRAGGNVVDAFVEQERRGTAGVLGTPVAVDAAETDLRELQHVPREQRVSIGPDGPGTSPGPGRTRGVDAVRRALDGTEGGTDATLVVAGLGGSTGGRVAPAIARHARRTDDRPVYGLALLPASDDDGDPRAAARAFGEFRDAVDNLLLFDNDAWREIDETPTEAFETNNREIARRFGLLFGTDPGDEGVAASVAGGSALAETLAAGDVSTLGYAVERVPELETGLFDLFPGAVQQRTAPGPGTAGTTRLVREATLGGLSLPCEAATADRALFVIGGPPGCLNRQAVDRSHRWLIGETGTPAVHGGDRPLPDADHVAAGVLLTGVETPRIAALERRAGDGSEPARL